MCSFLFSHYYEKSYRQKTNFFGRSFSGSKVKQHWAQSVLGWVTGGDQKVNFKEAKFFFSLSALFLRGTLFFNRYIILHTEKKWIKESNRHPFQFSWFQQKWKYSLRAKYTRYNLPNELIWSKIEWKSLKWRKKV